MIARAALLAAPLAACTQSPAEQRSLAAVAAYVDCTAKARGTTDPGKVSPASAGVIVDKCEKQLNTAARAKAAWQKPGDPKIHPDLRIALERHMLRELAICETSSEADRTMCGPRID